MKTYKFKLYSHHGNCELHQTIDGHARVWNHCIALRRRYYALYGQYINKFRLINHISQLKRLPQFADWNQLLSQAIQDVAARIDKKCAPSRNALLIQALQRYLEYLEQEEIDAQIAQMAADSEYQKLHAQMVKEYEPAAWEALRLGEESA